MKIVYNTTTGDVTGINKSVGVGESEIKTTPQQLVRGMDPNWYKVENSLLKVLSQSDYDAITAPKLLAIAKTHKIDEVYQVFATAVRQPVTVDTFQFDGGWTSLQKLKIAIEISESYGLTERTFFESDETEHILPISDPDPNVLTGRKILYTVGMDYDSKDSQKRALIRAINESTNQTELDSIIISIV